MSPFPLIIQPSLWVLRALDFTQHADIRVQRNQEQPLCILAPLSKAAQAIARATETVSSPHDYTPKTIASVYPKAVLYPIAARLETNRPTFSTPRIRPAPQITPTPGEEIRQTRSKPQILKIQTLSNLLLRTRLFYLKTRLLLRVVFGITSTRVGIYSLPDFLILHQ